jgi:NAD(P)-dependent dehydrogenase (short-subunit alcohol dehydrogenase family)
VTHGRARYTGRIALVTGAGLGIGRAVAARLATEGADVVLTGRTQDTLENTADMVRAAGGRSLVVTGDVTSQSDMEAVAAHARAELGPVTIVVNNAGGGLASPIGGASEVWQEQITRNLTSAAIVGGAVWQDMADAGGGVLVNVGSISGRLPTAGIAAYCAAKAGLEMLTKSLALEGAPHGIRAVCVVPGAVLTPTLQKWIDTFEDPASQAAALASSSILGRLGSADDIASAVTFLASDDASYITGTTLLVDGGQSIGRT